ncbi:transposase [Rhodoferax sp. TBRC 17660]|uniref:Transposase n=1 Tax=Rhodoferax potami TaxID=3068338 RepID=A0ABU3KSX0_9BURK|nr:transposase [Rhodoferax sp. TBRC 17660]MDT7520760.1 transposase [Rhodoferax sp. TBRC 17660]
MVRANNYGTRNILIWPGRAMQNGYTESFNCKFRSDSLNDQRFETLRQACPAVCIWLQDYNDVRPHSRVRRIPPARSTTLVKFRGLSDKDGVEELLAQTITAAVNMKLISPKELAAVVVDSTVQTKAIKHPTDSKLLQTTHHSCTHCEPNGARTTRPNTEARIRGN